jgi:K+-transporting ATPase ATPase A chain
MNKEILGLITMFVAAILLGLPLGRHMAKVYRNEPTFLDPVLNPVERLIFRLSGIDASREQNWKEQLFALLTLNLIWFLLGIFILMNQGWLPLNPDGSSGQSADLAFNTVISFLVNCDLQHYSGETGVSYFSQLYLMFLQFVSAATGMAASVTVFHALQEDARRTAGNYYRFFLKSITRILIPLSVVVAVILLFNHMPMSFDGKQQMVTLQGDTTYVSTGPVAAFVPIKHLGTNGGGFFGANSAHPFENVNYFTNMIEMIAQMIIPIAMVFALGFFLKKRKMSIIILTVMTVGFLILVIPSIIAESKGNPNLAAMGVDMTGGNMEGKEVRFGAPASAYWGIATTVISTGSVNAMHESFMPLSVMNMMLAMMTNSFYGGVGVGILNYFIFIILAVFISGLMVGRTPEFLGRKVEAREMKIAMIIALLHPLLILTGTALATVFAAHTVSTPGYPGFHGFSEMLYEFTSSAANNGSSFAGLQNNTRWWNISTGLVLILSRYIGIIGPVAIAGLLAQKKITPATGGTLNTDTPTFGFMVFAVIIIIAALSFLPALTLGPVAEIFNLK